MSLSAHDSLNQAERALIFTPDVNDPTAGRIAISVFTSYGAFWFTASTFGRPVLPNPPLFTS